MTTIDEARKLASTITFTVLGEARPAGSKRAFALRKNGVLTGRVAVADANPNSKGWKQEVAHEAFKACRGRMLDGPLRVTFQFYRPRPKGHYGTRGLNKKGLASTAPTGRPDVLKLARGVEDACTGVIWFDDAQIVCELLTKEWGSPARVEVTIEPLTEANL